MGYNSSVIVMNDALHDIAADPDFGKNLSRAITSLVHGKPVDVRALNHVNAATAIESHHADNTSLVSFGGNCGVAHLQMWGWKHNDIVEQEMLCRKWAEKLGFRLVRKSVK